MTAQNRITLKFLLFQGLSVPPARLNFQPGLNLVWGASNTGKTFAVQALDFMFGAKKLRQIDELQGYESIYLGLSFTDGSELTLRRSKSGGDFAFREELCEDGFDLSDGGTLGAKHSEKADDNLSAYLLKKLGLRNKKIVKNKAGEKVGLSFRNIIRYSLVPELDILSSISPALSPNKILETFDRGVLRLLLTAMDDGAIVASKSAATRKQERTGRVDMLHELLDEARAELLADHPDVKEYEDQLSRLEGSLTSLSEEFETMSQSVLALSQKESELRRDSSEINLELRTKGLQEHRFEALRGVYASDLARLAALEEGAFLLSLGAGRPCPLCGADAEHHGHVGVAQSASDVNAAAQAEIAKIAALQAGLDEAIESIHEDKALIRESLGTNASSLANVAEQLRVTRLEATTVFNSIRGFQKNRDRIREGLDVQRRIHSMEERLEEAKQAGPQSSSIKIEIPSKIRDSFSQTVRKILTDWEYPDIGSVAFNEAALDVEINGTERQNNGKGVLAITHAAFKLAVLKYALDRDLPHPGFLVLDTPLLTYRDPIRDPLSPAETKIAKSALKDRFLVYLQQLGPKVQSIVMENFEPQPLAKQGMSVEVFTKSTGGRHGLLTPLDKRGSPALELTDA